MPPRDTRCPQPPAVRKRSQTRRLIDLPGRCDSHFAAADAALQTEIARRATSDPYTVAQIYAIRNDADKTFEWLDRAWSYRDPGIASLLINPFLTRYKDDPRFAAFCRKVGLPMPSERAGG